MPSPFCSYSFVEVSERLQLRRGRIGGSGRVGADRFTWRSLQGSDLWGVAIQMTVSTNNFHDPLHSLAQPLDVTHRHGSPTASILMAHASQRFRSVQPGTAVNQGCRADESLPLFLPTKRARNSPTTTAIWYGESASSPSGRW